MSRYDIQQVCLNGHQITIHYRDNPEDRKKNCPKCGAKTIHQCPSCKIPIKGYEDIDGFYLGGFDISVPNYCEECSNPFPWTVSNEDQSNQKNYQDELLFSDIKPLDLVINLCTRFHLVAKQLRNRHDSRNTLSIQDEYDVQDLLYGLLNIYFNDIRVEDAVSSYAGSNSRVDFLLKKEQIGIEVKKTRNVTHAKKLGEELIIDIERYQNHEDIKDLVFLIYDPDEYISNPTALKDDIENNSSDMNVVVKINPLQA